MTHKIKVSQIADVFRSIGVKEKSGKVEIFPSVKNGMRLPFGYIPGKDFDSTAWLGFIRRYQSSNFPLINWKHARKRAEIIARSLGIQSR